MDTGKLLEEAKHRLGLVTEYYKTELTKIRTGRAHPDMLEGVSVEAYGQAMPLKSVAGITAPEPQLLQITPFDPNNLKAISDAIRSNQNLALTPTDDGRVVRISIPPLTEETRRSMVKILNQKEEDSFISARQIRHDIIRKAEQAEKDKSISKDDLSRLEKQIDELMAKQKIEIGALSQSKDHEIMTI